MPDMQQAILKRSNDRQRIAARAHLLKWASSVVGLPLSHIKQVQNGAVFCHIVAAFGQLDVANVQFLAVEECEYQDNYRLLQLAGGSIGWRGLNSNAKLRHWLRLAESEADAWHFLALLKKQYKKACVCAEKKQIEPDATPPPGPLPPKKGTKRGASHVNTNLTESYTGHWSWTALDVPSVTLTTSELAPFSHALPSYLPPQEQAQELKPPGAAVLFFLPQTRKAVSERLADNYADTSRTQHARSCLLSMLTQSRQQTCRPSMPHGVK